jgi:hypothetical protein
MCVHEHPPLTAGRKNVFSAASASREIDPGRAWKLVRPPLWDTWLSTPGVKPGGVLVAVQPRIQRRGGRTLEGEGTGGEDVSELD